MGAPRCRSCADDEGWARTTPDRAAIADRHAQGGRSARENIADLIDEGSFVEYGGLATAAQEDRLDAEQLLRQTPADGLAGGICRINGDIFRGGGRVRRTLL